MARSLIDTSPPPIWETSLAVDSMYYHAALQNYEHARDARKAINLLRREWEALEAEEEEILERFNGDGYKAADELEPIAIRMGHLHSEMENAYKPYLEALAVTHILCAASLEAYVNSRAKESLTGKRWQHFEKLSLEGKWLFYPKIIGYEVFDPGAEPFQSFSKLVKLRNALIHYKERKEEWRFGEIPSFIRDLGLSLNSGKRSLSTVKDMVNKLTKHLKEDAPIWIKDEPWSYFTITEKTI
jgi:hypothetical protein